MHPELSQFATRLRGQISGFRFPASDFPAMALELFALQFRHNSAYRKICEARGFAPQSVGHWTEIPAVPAAAFKELELTSLAPDERTAVFHSSGTTNQKPSRHFHSLESLAVYEASLWNWFKENCGLRIADCGLLLLTPSAEQAPHSSLVHMFETVRRQLGGASVSAKHSEYLGLLADDGAWTLDLNATLAAFAENPKPETRIPKLVLGTAFSFVHLLDHLASKDLVFNLPENSLVMETGGYKNRSRTLPKAELHALITERLGVPLENILCEYGMSELSSQAYDRTTQNLKLKTQNSERQFRFPPWAQVRIISPETGREAAEGETGLIRIFDLANVFSVAAIQTEDLGIRRGDGFELTGRAQQAEPRGCSLLAA